MFRTTENNIPQPDNAPEENENANPDHSESNSEDWSYQISQSELPINSISEKSVSCVMREQKSRVSRRQEF
jgi:hypothetical protein